MSGLRPAILVSPRVIKPGAVFWILAAFDTAFRDVRVTATGPGGPLKSLKTKRGGGPPFWQAEQFRAGQSGLVSVGIKADRQSPETLDLEVGAGGTPRPPTRSAWKSEKGWTRAEEDLYSAWLDALFLGSDERASWRSLDEVMRDPQRNILFDYLGFGEEGSDGKPRVEMTPDCADAPFFFRAYFAWKLGLPFGFYETSWGGLGVSPRGERWWTNDTLSGAGDPVRSFAQMLPMVKNVVHAGNGRTAFATEESDYYPLPLKREALRAGSVFADPYGHTLTVVRWEPQTPKRPGRLLAVNAQPDGTIGLHRFWRGNFLFATEDVVGEPGFKAFRPIVLDGGRPRLLTNDEIGRSPDYGNLSLQQRKMAPAVFYKTMARLINPDPLDAETALRDLVQAFHEQLIVRVESVSNGIAYAAAHPGTVIPMPYGGSEVFQTTGTWEDFSTPNRDLRLLIAIDTLLEFPDEVAAHPETYKVSGRESPAAVKAGLLELESKLARDATITYIRSDGRPRTLTLEDIFQRKEAFEMAYNPNDGPEVRWGAPEASEELASCRRRAPAYQVERMSAMRPWFQKRLHPPT